ncbi:MAG: hypothetical protein DI629_13335 [Mesorhizobium amorphae]|nr:MAG: hypothetical protein DI629_13335 [Mesorhizobium amorphae]
MSQNPQPTSRATLLGAGAFLLGFAVLAYFMPSIMLALGGVSTTLAVVVVALFIVAPFAVLWLRARAQKRRDEGRL